MPLSIHSVTEEIISKVRSIPKDRIVDMKNELQAAEPILYNWAKETAKEEAKEIRYSGVVIQSEEALRHVGSVILQAKIEGFLIGLMAHDNDWNNRFLMRDKSLEVPYLQPVTALMEGRLGDDIYEKIKISLTSEEKTNPNHWKIRALIAHDEFLSKKVMMDKARGVFDPGKASPELPVSPLVDIKP